MTQDSHQEGVYRLPANLDGELEQLGQMAEQVAAGTLSPDRFRAFRVPMGVYEQRESGRFMLRVRFPAGALLPHQMRVLADVSRRFGNGVLHVTSRQDIQVHRVSLADIYPAQTALRAAGLATKGGGGNTVRNITACAHAGVCPHEVFDVAPHAVALTEFLLPDPLSHQLPRKYKIAFSGCRRDCAGATVNDLGLIARCCNGVDGFVAHVAGGMGARSRVASPFEAFVPVAEVHLVAEAVKRVFDKHGNRRDKHKARLRFLVEEIGLNAFRRLYLEELAALRRDPPPRPELRPLPAGGPPSDAAGDATPAPPAEGFDAWREACVSPQKQAGRHIVELPLLLGDVDAGTLEALAGVVEAHGERMLRTTQSQNLVLRWVAQAQLTTLHAALAGLGLAPAEPAVLRSMVACAGAATCRLGICLSRGLARAIRDALTADGLDLERLGDVAIHISGCPNSCGRHPVGPVGLFGGARRIEGRLVPHYVVQLGGRVAEGETRLAAGNTALPARNIPAFLRALLGAYLDSPQCPDFHAFLDAGGRQVAEDLAAEHRHVASFEQDKNFYFDWGAEEMFSLAGRGPGECSAGVFDLIEVDLASAREALRERRHYQATALAARALLVTRGEQPDSDLDALRLFQKLFVEADLVHRRFEPLLAAAAQSAGGPQPEAAFAAEPDDVAALVDAVAGLYESMDNSLRFTPQTAEARATSAEARATSSEALAARSSQLAARSSQVTPDLTKDFRGVACPLNYVKTKLALDMLEAGQILAVLLDEEGARNCPASATSDGHEVLDLTQLGDHWRLVLRKGAS